MTAPVAAIKCTTAEQNLPAVVDNETGVHHRYPLLLVVELAEHFTEASGRANSSTILRRPMK